MCDSKICTICQEEKLATLEFFYKNTKCKLNLDNRCKKCLKRYRDERKKAKSEYDKQYRRKNKERLSEYRNQYYIDNKKQLNDYRKEHYEKNKRFYIANAAKQKADKRNQTPDFANLKLIASIYNNCPEGCHVDHMIPLSIGGLHHESNLCYLPESVNMAKSCKSIEEFGEAEFNKHVIYWQDILII